jgi:hypothetical protein
MRVGLPDVPAHELVGGRGTAASLVFPPGGLTIGVDSTGSAVVLRLLREKPVRARVLAAGPLAQVLAFRAIALGARVTVVTDQVAAWSRLAAAVPRPATGQIRQPGLTVLPSGSTVSAVGTAASPVLVIDATVASAALPRWEQGPWQTFVSLDAPAALRPADLADLRSFDLLLAERVPPFAVEQVRDAYGTPYDQAVWLSQLPTGRIAVAVPGQLSVADLHLSPAEQKLLAP